MTSSEGEFRNGKKNAELAYLLPISGNSGVQKRMAFLNPTSGKFPFGMVPKLAICHYWYCA